MVVPEHPESTAGRDAEAQLSQQGFRDQLLSRLQLVDFMAVLMVAATTCSGFATWRTASIAKAIYLAAERAFFGIVYAALDISRPSDPRVTIDYRNLGNVSATDLKIMRRAFIDGVEIKSSTRVTTPGILSPGPSHLVYLPIPPAAYAFVVVGKSSLEVQIARPTPTRGAILSATSRIWFTIPGERFRCQKRLAQLCGAARSLAGAAVLEREQR